MSTEDTNPAETAQDGGGVERAEELAGAHAKSLVEMGAEVAGWRSQYEAKAAEVAELRALFDLQWRRMGEATARWRAEDPEACALVMPDLGDLLQWLMDDADRARSGGWYLGRCGNEREPDGELCTADLYVTTRTDVQVQCPECGAWTGVGAPGRPGPPVGESAAESPGGTR